MAEEEIAVYAEEPRRYLIARAAARFDKGKTAVETAKCGKFRIPTVWLNQQVRQERGYQDDVSRNGNWVLQGVLYRQKANNVFTSTGLPYLHPAKAVLARSKLKEYTLEGCTQDELDRAIAEGLEINPMDLNESGDIIIPCSDFGSNKYGLWFFGGKGSDKERRDMAKESGLWFINAPGKINEIAVLLDKRSYSNSIGKDYANQMWFRSLGSGSGLLGFGYWNGSLRFVGGVLGVYDSAEGASQNFAKK